MLSTESEKRLFEIVFDRVETRPCPICGALLKLTPYSNNYPTDQYGHCLQKINNGFKVICPHQGFKHDRTKRR